MKALEVFVYVFFTIFNFFARETLLYFYMHLDLRFYLPAQATFELQRQPGPT